MSSISCWGRPPLEGSELYTWTVQRSEYNSSTGKFDTDTRYIIVPGDGATNYEMPDYDSADDGQPWISAGISTVYIAEEITSVGDNAFNGLTTLESVVFQDASTSPPSAPMPFPETTRRCSPMRAGTGRAWISPASPPWASTPSSSCAKLTSVTLGGSITAHETDEEGREVITDNKIPSHAFSGTGLTEIEIPAGTEHIGDSAFEKLSPDHD